MVIGIRNADVSLFFIIHRRESPMNEHAGDSVRQRLLKAALDGFLADEYHKVTTRQIAERAGGGYQTQLQRLVSAESRR